MDLFENYTSTATDALQQYNNDTKVNKWTTAYLKKYVLPYLKKINDPAILEIGCGWGKYIKGLHDLGYNNITGIDISKEQVDFAKLKMKLKNVILADAKEFLINNKKKYDLVLMLDVMEHLPLEYSIELMNLIKINLKKEGIFIMQTPNGLSPLNPIRYADLTHVRSFTTTSASQLFKLTGFDQFEFLGLEPLTDGVKNTFRFILWKLLFHPVILTFMVLANGTTFGTIYTANLISIAKNI
jgi:2-polyprenyl-3-methyl-5-hydroxy-6-metoxy-1,4-benzoquinol methylase